ncbi:MAG: alpha/beta fold hydrolase [Myxococcota bacterium]
MSRLLPWGVLPCLIAVGCAPKAPPTAPAALTEVSMQHPWIDVPRREVVAATHRLAVFDTGGEGPPVVLVHGLGSHSGFWQKQLTGGRLGELRLIAPDLPGWGDSDQPDGPYTPSWYASALVHMLDALNLPRAHIVGHSMGGQAAIALALEHPERVASLTLVAPAGIETFTDEEGALIRGFWTDDRLRGRTEEAARASYGFVFGRWDEDVERLLQHRMALDRTDRVDGMIRAVQRSVAGMLAEPVRHRLGELAMPVHYVYGTDDKMIPAAALHPTLTPKSIADDAKSAVAQSRITPVAGAGHTPHHDDPAAFDDAFLAFIQSLPDTSIP